SGTTTITGLAFFNGSVALGISIAGIDISDVSGLQSALDLKAPSASPTFYGHHDRHNKGYDRTW
ncbi:MAG: hypothetical protein ACKPKO_05175, partial [Candidatus Fonsibacter sp.]